MEALEMTVLALSRHPKDVVFLIDNQTVIRQFTRLLNRQQSLPRYQFGRWLNIARVMIRSNLNMRVFWIPSHGKQPQWKPEVSDFGSSQDWRDWNDIADEFANTGRELQKSMLQIVDFQQRSESAAKWAGKAIGRMVHGAHTPLHRTRSRKV
jgi:hypothetical protein